MKRSKNLNESRRQARRLRSQEKRVVIILVGFMGAGKTTVANALAQKLESEMADLDHFIEAREGRKIASIIDADGEARFREIETQALRDALEKNETHIIALGGGAWTIEENRKLIAEHDCLTVWLDAPFELCWSRITNEGNTRPLARDKNKARNLYNTRREVYKLATLKLDASQNLESLIAAICGPLI
jgi:shikimate kinase